ncbi:MAG: hypothetical protein DI629_18980 [Mesorhizobium amorphae]|nr:MAG: hypothetical protein DI629_18980 [Mesorhizobium amorphae]
MRRFAPHIMTAVAALAALPASAGEAPAGGEPGPAATVLAAPVTVRVPAAEGAPRNLPVPHPAPPIAWDRLPAAKAFRSLPVRDRFRLQEELARMGVAAGPIDGRWGPATWAGLTEFATREGVAMRLVDVGGSYGVMRRVLD